MMPFVTAMMPARYLRYYDTMLAVFRATPCLRPFDAATPVTLMRALIIRAMLMPLRHALRYACLMP